MSYNNSKSGYKKSRKNRGKGYSHKPDLEKAEDNAAPEYAGDSLEYDNYDGAEDDYANYDDYGDYDGGASVKANSGGLEPANALQGSMPPRNILESDSAKYTAEYIKEVVKGLYTIEGESEDTYKVPDSFNSKNPHSQGVNARAHDTKRAASGKRQGAADTDKKQRENYANAPLNASASARVNARTGRRNELFSESELEGGDFIREETQKRADLEQESFLKGFEKRSASAANDYGRAPSGSAFKKTGELKFFGASRNAQGAAELESALSGTSVKRQQPKASKSTAGVSFAEPAVSRSKHEPYGDYSEYGENSGGYDDYGGYDGSDVYDDYNGYDGSNGSDGYGGYDVRAFDEDFVSLKEVRKMTQKNKGASQSGTIYEDEKIPIIINRNITGKSRKTVEDYKNPQRNPQWRAKPAAKAPADEKRRAIDSGREVRQASGNGASVIVIVFAVTLIGVIGFLVWELRNVSKELNELRGEAEAVAAVSEQFTSLQQKNGELEYTIEQLEFELSLLKTENERLINTYEPESPESEAPAEQENQAANAEIEDGYYTVKPGDTLWKISERFLGTGDLYLQLARENNLDPSRALYTGLRLKIPNVPQ